MPEAIPAVTDKSFDRLVECSRQYAAYLRVNAASQSPTEAGVLLQPDHKPYADWAHPIGLVVGASV